MPSLCQPLHLQAMPSRPSRRTAAPGWLAAGTVLRGRPQGLVLQSRNLNLESAKLPKVPGLGISLGVGGQTHQGHPAPQALLLGWAHACGQSWAWLSVCLQGPVSSLSASGVGPGPRASDKTSGAQRNMKCRVLVQKVGL